ncbi:tetratricopeptide repeat protein [soil metagenome]
MLPSQKITSYWPFGLLLVLVFFIYGPSIGYDFVWDDERTHLTSNTYLTEGDFGHFWQEPYEGLYIPVSYTAWGLIYKVTDIDAKGHPDPATFHIINLLLHLLNGWLVFAIIRLFIPHIAAAALGAALFMLHPLQVETVAWVSEFRGLLATFFGLAALFFYWGVPADNKSVIRTYVIPSILLILAMLSKPNMVVLPAFAFVGDVMLRHKRWDYSLITAMCAMLFTLPVIFMALDAQPTTNVSFIPPLWSRPLLALDALNFYLSKLVAPFSLSPSYGRTPQSLIEASFIKWTLLVPVVVGVLFAIFYKHARPFLACLILFSLGFATVSGLVPFYFQKFSNVADRYIYLSMFPAGLALSYAVYKLGRGAQVGATVLIMFFGGVTFLQVPIWEKEYTLWDKTIARYPEQALPYNNRGVVNLDQKRFELAVKDFSKSIQYDSTFASAYNNRGNALALLSKFQEAITDYNKAIALKPDYGRAYYNRSLTYANMGQYPQASKDLVMAGRLGYKANPSYVKQLEQAMGR